MGLNKTIWVINGPNLNLLGKREPEVYGSKSFETYFAEIKEKFPDYSLHYFQSNHEGFIIDKLHEIGFGSLGIVLNGGAFTHYSYAIADAIAAIPTPVVEVHISNIYEREDFRKISVTKDNCIGNVFGKGLPGYDKAIEMIIDKSE